MKKKHLVLNAWRIFLAILILLNMALIFGFSAQNGKQSTELSDKVGAAVSTPIYGSFEEKSAEEKEEIRLSTFAVIRKIAHILEYASLGALVFLFVLSWKGTLLWKYIGSAAFCTLYAASDEWHQSFVPERSATPFDVLYDLGGILIGASLILLFYLLIRKGETNLKTTRYFLTESTKARRLKLAVVADLHGDDPTAALALLQKEQPDLILIPGDLMDDETLADAEASGYAFLRECASLAPTYYSIGNHEIACYHKGNPWRHPVPTPLSKEIRDRIRQTGAVLLDNESILREDGIRICALTSGLNGKKNAPDADALARFEREDGFRILLCHHPEYYVPHIRPTDIELTVCGHAHGGQWRIFGRGVYAPGQGLFPKYTSGVIDHRCVISRGIANHAHVPRIFNSPELVMIYYGYKPEEFGMMKEKSKSSKDKNIRR